MEARGSSKPAGESSGAERGEPGHFGAGRFFTLARSTVLRDSEA